MRKKKILILFYSLGGGTAKLARAVGKGAESVVGTQVEIKRIPEILPQKYFDKNPKLKERKERLEKEFSEATIEDLVEADGVAFGTPVHFGSFASQVKQFIDQLSAVWMQKKIVNKPASVFCVSGSMHGGEEVTLVSLMIPLLNLGMLPVGIPFPIQGEGSDFDSGSPYGAIFVNRADGTQEMSEDDKKAAGILGSRLAIVTQLLNCDCDKCNSFRESAQQEDSSNS